MIRLFVGIGLPDALRQRLAALGGGIPNARWSPPDNLHITLRFIGEVQEPVAEEIHTALSAIRGPKFDLSLSDFGAFENRHRAHTLWAGLEKSPELAHLRDKVESGVVRVGLPPEARKFAPHVTLARIKGAPPERVQNFLAHTHIAGESFTVDHFSLYSSILGNEGPTYTAEADYPLD